MHALNYSHYPSSALAGVKVDSGRFWQIVSSQREDKFIVLRRAAEKSAALFVLSLFFSLALDFFQRWRVFLRSSFHFRVDTLRAFGSGLCPDSLSATTCTRFFP
jgi:hypothetical protein